MAATEAHTRVCPGAEMGANIDGASGTLVATNGPELLEGASSVDRRLVGAGGDGKIVDGAVDGDATLVLSTRRRVVGAEVFNDVVLNERVAGPAVDGEI